MNVAFGLQKTTTDPKVQYLMPDSGVCMRLNEEVDKNVKNLKGVNTKVEITFDAKETWTISFQFGILDSDFKPNFRKFICDVVSIPIYHEFSFGTPVSITV